MYFTFRVNFDSYDTCTCSKTVFPDCKSLYASMLGLQLVWLVGVNLLPSLSNRWQHFLLSELCMCWSHWSGTWRSMPELVVVFLSCSVRQCPNILTKYASSTRTNNGLSRCGFTCIISLVLYGHWQRMVTVVLIYNSLLLLILTVFAMMFWVSFY